MKKSYQKRGGVERSDGDRIKDLGLLQGSELLFPVAQNLLQEGLLPGVKLQNLDSIQDLIHQPDATVHELHLNLLWTQNKPSSEHGFTAVVLSLHTFYCCYISVKGNNKGDVVTTLRVRVRFNPHPTFLKRLLFFQMNEITVPRCCPLFPFIVF